MAKTRSRWSTSGFANVSGTHLYDGIYVCGNNNPVQNNIIVSSGQSGVHLDTSCNGIIKFVQSYARARNLVRGEHFRQVDGH